MRHPSRQKRNLPSRILSLLAPDSLEEPTLDDDIHGGLRVSVRLHGGPGGVVPNPHRGFSKHDQPSGTRSGDVVWMTLRVYKRASGVKDDIAIERYSAPVIWDAL